jgi:ribosomal protein S10
MKLILKLFNSLNGNKNLNIIKKCQKNTKKKQLLTILKSPHVNKTAQEQFEFKISSSQFLIKPTTKSLKFLLFFKKTVSKLFPDSKIVIKLVSNKKIKSQNYKETFNFNNFKTNNLISLKKKILTKLKLLDTCGELVFK